MNLLGVFHWEKTTKKFFEQPNNQKLKNKKLNKCNFQGFANSQYFFVKISGIGPWMCKIDRCKGHWCGSTYMDGFFRILEKTSSKLICTRLYDTGEKTKCLVIQANQPSSLQWMSWRKNCTFHCGFPSSPLFSCHITSYLTISKPSLQERWRSLLRGDS